MLHHYRIPPGVTGTINGTESFDAEDAMIAIKQKRKLYRDAGLPSIAKMVTAFTMQVNFGHEWIPTAAVSIRHGGMRARGGR